MQWIDWNAGPSWLDWLSLVLGVIAFIIALAELGRTRSSAEAASAGLEAARRQLVANQALGIDAAFTDIRHDVESAVLADNRGLARIALVRYSRVVQELAGLLESVPGDHTDIRRHLVRSGAEALRVKVRVVEAPPDTKVETIVAKHSTDMETLSGRIASLMVDFRNQPSQPAESVKKRWWHRK